MNSKTGCVIKATLSVALFSVLVIGGGCETSAQTGSLIGVGVGAAVGQWIGKDTEGTLIGAGVGAAAGYMIGNEMDKKESREREEQRLHDDQP